MHTILKNHFVFQFKSEKKVAPPFDGDDENIYINIRSSELLSDILNKAHTGNLKVQSFVNFKRRFPLNPINTSEILSQGISGIFKAASTHPLTYSLTTSALDTSDEADTPEEEKELSISFFENGLIFKVTESGKKRDHLYSPLAGKYNLNAVYLPDDARTFSQKKWQTILNEYGAFIDSDIESWASNSWLLPQDIASTFNNKWEEALQEQFLRRKQGLKPD